MRDGDHRLALRAYFDSEIAPRTPQVRGTMPLARRVFMYFASIKGAIHPHRPMPPQREKTLDEPLCTLAER